jgi:hypothetical protein
MKELNNYESTFLFLIFVDQFNDIIHKNGKFIFIKLRNRLVEIEK